MNNALKDLDKAFDSIIDEIENPGSSHGAADIFRNLHGEKTEYADYAKVVYTIIVRVSEDRMTAVINVVSTAGKIRRYTMDELNRAIRSNGIVYGIDSGALMNMVAKQTFNTDVVFAKGSLPHDGKDGFVEHFIKLRENAVTGVKSGAAICRVTAPEAGTAGSDVLGNPIPAANGKKIVVPKGENTVFDRKSGILSAAAGGSLRYKNGVYSICDEYVINGSVTKDDGKIEFAGNIIIKGGVQENSIVIAEKSIVITGKANGAVITAGEGVTIAGSVKNSVITAENGDISLNSCTDSTVNCGGNLTAASLYNCNTKCAGSLDCTINQGSLNGGVTKCIGKVTCTTLGSRLHEQTTVIIGDCSEYLTERVMLMRSLTRIESDIERVSDSIRTREKREKSIGFLSREDMDFLEAARRLKKQKSEECQPIKERIEAVERIIDSASDSNLKVMRFMHSNVTLQIKKHIRKIDSEFGKIVAYANDYGIVIS